MTDTSAGKVAINIHFDFVGGERTRNIRHPQLECKYLIDKAIEGYESPL